MKGAKIIICSHRVIWFGFLLSVRRCFFFTFRNNRPNRKIVCKPFQKQFSGYKISETNKLVCKDVRERKKRA